MATDLLPGLALPALASLSNAEMSRIRFPGLVICLAMALSPAPPAVAQQILFVDAPGSGPITSLQAAIDLAADGDVIALRNVNFTTAFVQGKGLTILSLGAAHSAGNRLEARDVPTGSMFVARGLNVYYLRFTDCAGAVLVDQCNALSDEPLKAVRCAHLQLTRSTFNSTQGVDLVTAELRESHLVADQCHFTGAEGQHGYNSPFCSAANGTGGDTGLLIATQSTAWLQTCTLRGGCGGPGGACTFGTGAPGANAPGLRVDATSIAYARDVTSLGCTGNSGNIVLLQGPPIRLEVPAIVRPRTQAPLGLMGVSLGQGLLLAATRIAPRFVGAEPGWFQADANVVGGRMPLGQFNSSGQLASQALTPFVAPTGVLPVAIQGVCVTPAGAPRFAPVRWVLVAGDQSGL